MSPFGSPSAGTNSANSCRRTRTIARSVRRRTLRLEPPPLARFRSEAIAIQSASVSSETSPRIHQDHHDSATPKFGPSESPAPVRAASLRDPATTGPRRPPRYRTPIDVAVFRARKMRPADLCKPELSKTSTRAFGAYPASQVMSPTRVMRCAVHAVAASFGPPRGTTSSFFGRRSLLRLASSAPSPHASARTRTESYDQGRFSRRLVTGDALHDPKHLPPTSALLRARDRRSGVATFATVPGRPSTDSHEGIRARSRTRAQPQPCVRTSIGRPFAGICKQPKARARPAKRPNLARTEAFSAPERCPRRAASRETPGKTGLAPRRRRSREPTNDQSACARGTEAS